MLLLLLSFKKFSYRRQAARKHTKLVHYELNLVYSVSTVGIIV